MVPRPEARCGRKADRGGHDARPSCLLHLRRHRRGDDARRGPAGDRGRARLRACHPRRHHPQRRRRHLPIPLRHRRCPSGAPREGTRSPGRGRIRPARVGRDPDRRPIRRPERHRRLGCHRRWRSRRRVRGPLPPDPHARRRAPPWSRAAPDGGKRRAVDPASGRATRGSPSRPPRWRSPRDPAGPDAADGRSERGHSRRGVSGVRPAVHRGGVPRDRAGRRRRMAARLDRQRRSDVARSRDLGGCRRIDRYPRPAAPRLHGPRRCARNLGGARVGREPAPPVQAPGGGRGRRPDPGACLPPRRAPRRHRARADRHGRRGQPRPRPHAVERRTPRRRDPGRRQSTTPRPVHVHRGARGGGCARIRDPTDRHRPGARSQPAALRPVPPRSRSGGLLPVVLPGDRGAAARDARTASRRGPEARREGLLPERDAPPRGPARDAVGRPGADRLDHHPVRGTVDPVGAVPAPGA